MTESASPEDPMGGHRLTAAERLDLAMALLARTDRTEDGRAAFRRKYASAPEAMVITAAHHVYTDGPTAVIDFLAEAELAIRDPAHEIGYGTSWELLYHVYNWLQFRALLPEGKQFLLDMVSQMEEAVAENDREFMIKSLKELRDAVDGGRSAPDFDQS